MANIKEAFDYAAQNPDSDFANNLKSLAASGSLDAEAQKYNIDLTPFKPKPVANDAVEFAKGVGKGVGRLIRPAAQFTQDIGQSVLSVVDKNAFAPNVGIESLKGETPQGQALTQSLEPTNDMQKYGGYAELAGEVLLGGGAQAIKQGAKAVATEFKPIANALASLPKNIGQKAIDLVSADPSKKVETILARSTPEEVKSFVDLAEKASISGEAATPFEVVGNRLSDVTKTLESRLGDIGKAKSAIIEPLREGLGAFKAETKPFIERLTSLKNSFGEIDKGSKTIVQAIINDAKKVSTKLDADRLIDKVQNALYTGSRDMTIPQGSALDKQLRGLLGEYNSLLKAALPEEYAALNKQYSELIDTLGVINRSLGEVVEGVPVQGASLIKQYFSPSGTKAKEIFEFIKRETGVDLAKESTLAKFSMELFDDPRARSLLQGIGDIPTTLEGIVSKAAEKVGGESLQNALRTSTVRKATGKASLKSGSETYSPTTQGQSKVLSSYDENIAQAGKSSNAKPVDSIFVSEERYQQAKKSLAEKQKKQGGQLKMSVLAGGEDFLAQTPELITIASYHIGNGIKTTAELTKMLAKEGYKLTKEQVEKVFKTSLDNIEIEKLKSTPVKPVSYLNADKVPATKYERAGKITDIKKAEEIDLAIERNNIDTIETMLEDYGILLKSDAEKVKALKYIRGLIKY